MATATAQTAPTADFTIVQPILAERCVMCHAGEGAPLGLQLDSFASLMEGSAKGAVAKGGNAAGSELIRRIKGDNLPRMPYDGPPFLTGNEIRLISDWIAGGARDAGGRPAAVPVGAEARLHGRLEAGWRLDGLVLEVDSGTRPDKGPRA